MNTKKKSIKWAVWLLLLILAAGLVLFFVQSAPAPPQKLPQTDDENASRVIVTGRGYVLNREDEQTEPQKEEEPQKQQETPQWIQKPQSGAQTEDQNGSDKNAADSDTSAEAGDGQSQLPTVETNLKDGEQINGDFTGFYVRARDYLGTYIGSFDLTVLANGEKLYSTGDNRYRVTYRATLAAGENLIEITARDDAGRTNTITRRILCDPDGERIPEGTITIAIEAKTLGLGYLVPAKEIDFYSGEQLSFVLDRFLKEQGIRYNSTGSLTNGFYLERIYRSGITSGYRIPDGLMSILEEIGFSESPHDANSLGEKDFTGGAGWMFSINGEFPDMGFSSQIPADGDEVELSYTLWYGRDVDGSWQWQ